MLNSFFLFLNVLVKTPKRSLSRTAPVYKPSRPFVARVVASLPLVEKGSADEVRHIVLDLGDSGLEYLEGQSIGVVPPGTRADGKPHKVRLYSIASCSLADEGFPNTVSLCVKRDVFEDGETGEIHRGLCSNYLCDASVGDELVCTGPVGKTFLLPRDASLPLMLFAAGTGIAPYRGFLDFIRREIGGWKGGVRLFFGAKTRRELLYRNEENDDLEKWKGAGVRIHYALSREQTNATGGKMYVQDRLKENMEEILPWVQSERFCLFVCGLKGIEAGIDEAFAERLGADFKAFKKRMRQEGKWNVEVY